MSPKAASKPASTSRCFDAKLWLAYHVSRRCIPSKAASTTFAKVLMPPRRLFVPMTRTKSPLYDQNRAKLHLPITLATRCDTLLPKLLSGESSQMVVDETRGIA